MITFHNSDATGPPSTSQVEVIGTLATDVTFANVFLLSQDQLEPLKHLRIALLT